MTDTPPSPAEDAPPRRRSWRRPVAILLALLLALPLLALGAAMLLVDPAALSPRIAEAVRRATGRELTIAGPVRVAWSLRPGVTAQRLSLSNPPGMSRPAMLTLARAEIRLAVLPLLAGRIEIDRITLVEPDLLLETDAAGRGNWQFERPAPPAPAGEAGPPRAPRPPPEIALAALHIERGRIAWRGGGRDVAVAIPALAAVAPSPGAPFALEGSVVPAPPGLEFRATGEAGPVAPLLAGADWPLRLSLAHPALRVALAGTLARAGWQARIEAAATDLAPLLPGVALPPLPPLTLAAAASGGPGQPPAVRDIRIEAGAADLAALRPGLRLAGARIALDRPEAPARIEAALAMGELPVALSGTAGPLLGAGPVALDLGLRAGEAMTTLRGEVADPRAAAGLSLLVAARVPDLAALAPLAGRPLPPLRDLAAEARIEGDARGPGPLRLHGLQVASPALAAEGELTLTPGAPPRIEGRIAAERIDLALLRPAPPPAGTPTPAAPAPRRPEGPRRVIPDLPLPAIALPPLAGEIALSVAVLDMGETEFRDLATTLRLGEGELRLQPLALTLPGGRVAGRALVVPGAAPPRLDLALRAPALELGPLLEGLGTRGSHAGRAELDLALAGAGHTLREVAAGAQGHLGLALVDGRVQGAAVEPLFEGLKRVLPIGPVFAGTLDLRCVALRLDIAGGVARTRTLLMDGALGELWGAFALDLGEETLAGRLRTDLRLGPLRVRTPVPLTGTLGAPRLDWSAAAGSAAAGEAGRLLGDALGSRSGAVLGALGEALGGNRGAPEQPPDCADALSVARAGREGPLPTRPAPERAPPAGQAPAPREPGQPPRDLPGVLRGLLGR